MTQRSRLHRQRVAILRTLHGAVATRASPMLWSNSPPRWTKSAATNERDAVLDEAQRILDARDDSESLSRAELHLQRAGAAPVSGLAAQRRLCEAGRRAVRTPQRSRQARRGALARGGRRIPRRATTRRPSEVIKPALAIAQTLTLGSEPSAAARRADDPGRGAGTAIEDRRCGPQLPRSDRNRRADLWPRSRRLHEEPLLLRHVPRKVRTGTQSNSLAATDRRNGSTHEGRGRDLSEFNTAVGVGDTRWSITDCRKKARGCLHARSR